MRSVDRRAIETLGIPGLSLMEAAGRGIAEAILRDYPQVRTLGLSILCGKGNNGGDGLVIARYLAAHGVTPQVILCGSGKELKGDAAVNLQAARDKGLEILEIPGQKEWAAHRELLDDTRPVVDALLGTGVRGGARGLLAGVIEDLNRRQSPVIAVDLPSGINADSPAVEGAAVFAEHTYTLCRPKLALVLEPASAHAGRWTVIPIGIPDTAVAEEEPEIEWLDPATAATLLPCRSAASHKGSYGHLLAVAGSTGKSGAAVLLARGALRCGVGLITVAAPLSVQERIAVQQAEVMTEPLPETGGGVLAAKAAGEALRLLAARSALALGPGLGTDRETCSMVAAVLAKRQAPAVLDADGLNAFDPARPEPAGELRAGSWPLVLTPHPGEAARLLELPTSQIQADRPAAARALAQRTGATVVLKGHRSLIAEPDGRLSINSSGNPGMATGGTGDVLTGAVGAFLARGLSGWDASRLAVFVHGLAGDRAARRLGAEGLIAGDIVDELPTALRDTTLGSVERG